MIVLVISILCAVLFLLGLLLCFIYNKEDRKGGDFFLGIVFASAIIALVLMLVCTIDVIRIKNFPESKYSLEYKITEFQGQVDTTYVLIPKK